MPPIGCRRRAIMATMAIAPTSATNSSVPATSIAIRWRLNSCRRAWRRALRQYAAFGSSIRWRRRTIGAVPNDDQLEIVRHRSFA